MLAALLLGDEHLGKHVPEDAEDAQFLGALLAPAGVDLAGVASPQLFGIALKEHAVELFAKAVDVVIFQVVVGTLVQRGAKEAHAHLHGGGKAHGLERLHLKADGIIEEVFAVIDAADAVAHQHDAVFLFRIRTAGGERNGAAQHPVVKGRRALQGHDVRPPVHHALVLAEKAMAADIHAVALIAHRLGDAADLVALFQNRYVIAVLEQLVRRRQSGGAGSDNPYFLHFVAPVLYGAILMRNGGFSPFLSFNSIYQLAGFCKAYFLRGSRPNWRPALDRPPPARGMLGAIPAAPARPLREGKHDDDPQVS